jgi:class 3 adenylate cyclase
LSELTARARARLPDSAFAYIDSKGRRRLPINDESHVRNALARFNQVPFETDAAREKARERLLKAAKKYGIVPIGFFDRQLRKERQKGEIEARSADVASLPRGVITFLLTDIEGSTGLLESLGDGYVTVLRDVRTTIRSAVRDRGGHEVDARADEYFGVFKSSRDALDAAIDIQRRMAGATWPDGAQVRVRIGLHTGRPTVTETGYLGISVHTAARIAWAGHGGQILMSSAAHEAVSESADGVRFRKLGAFPLPGLSDPQDLFQVEADGLLREFPPPRGAREPALA